MPRNASPVGALLREWRGLRGMSQLALAVAAEVSPRHLSFIETGRAEPSREMVLALGRALDVPFRERNAMLAAAGYAPAYRETSLDDPQMAEMRRAVELLLRQHEPFPAVALDRRWDVLVCNAAYARFLEALGGDALRLEPGRVLPAPRPNVLALLVGPLRDRIANWDEVAAVMLDRAQREAVMDRDPVRRRVVEECLAAVPEWTPPHRDQPAPLLVTIDLRLGGVEVHLFSTITTLGTAQDITLQELRIESFHPADGETERLLRAAAAETSSA